MARKPAIPLITDFNNIPEEALVPEAEQPFEIPSHWKWVRLGAVIHPMKSATPSGDYFTYIDIESINNSSQTIENPKILRSEEAPSRAKRFTKPGDILFSTVRPYLKNVAIIPDNLEHAIASTGFHVCDSIQSAIIHTYLFIVLSSDHFIGLSTQKMKGDNSPSIPTTEFLLLPIQLPPINEQKEIVTYFNQNLTAITYIDKKTEKSLHMLEELEQVLMRSAFNGQLINDLPDSHASQ